MGWMEEMKGEHKKPTHTTKRVPQKKKLDERQRRGKQRKTRRKKRRKNRVALCIKTYSHWTYGAAAAAGVCDENILLGDYSRYAFHLSSKVCNCALFRMGEKDFYTLHHQHHHHYTGFECPACCFRNVNLHTHAHICMQKYRNAATDEHRNNNKLM